MCIESSDSPQKPRGCATPDQRDATAYLIVHAGSGEPCPGGGRFGETRLQRLRALYRERTSTTRQGPLALKLTDRQGHELLSLTDAQPTLGIALPPGTYHLTATQHDVQRGYTVSLPAGVRFDLHLRFAPPVTQQPQQAASSAYGPLLHRPAT